MENFYLAVQRWTEKKLTQRKAKRLYQKQHRTFVSEVLEWLDALVFAVFAVLLINQFVFQLFVIPSPSMEDTLLIGDRVLVSKLTYGIEIFPDGPKIFANRTPDRDDIITFYNPEYESRGPVFDTLTQIIYMGTLSLVNIDKNPDGSPRERLLVKRAAGVAGDTVTFENGDAKIKLSGTGEYVDGASWRARNGYVTSPKRSIKPEVYTAYTALGRLDGMTKAGIGKKNLPVHLIKDQLSVDENEFYTDYYGYSKASAEGMRIADPSDVQARSLWMKLKLGSYVPDGYVLPLGDNRDNSSDGRYFGPVNVKKVNGFVCSRIWPVNRLASLVNL